MKTSYSSVEFYENFNPDLSGQVYNSVDEKTGIMRQDSYTVFTLAEGMMVYRVRMRSEEYALLEAAYNDERDDDYTVMIAPASSTATYLKQAILQVKKQRRVSRAPQATPSDPAPAE